jgi:hypothetical protein
VTGEVGRGEWRRVFEDLYEGLANVQTETGKPGWLAHESGWMLNAVNRHRARLELGPALMSEIDRAEQTALGHSDYTKKWAIACADLALTPTPAAPSEGAAGTEVGL